MNFTIKSYTPRILIVPRYDSLGGTQGCQTINGKTIKTFLPPSQICVGVVNFTTDPVLRPINPDGTVDYLHSYAWGPAEIGTPGPLETIWQAYWSTTGIRLTQESAPQLQSSYYGQLSGIWDDGNKSTVDIPQVISLAFDSDGIPYIALGTGQEIQVGWQDSSHKANFLGYYPCLFFSGLLYKSEGALTPEVGCYYMNVDYSRVLAMRLSSNGFSQTVVDPTTGEAGYVVVNNLPYDITQLIEAMPWGEFMKIYGVDGRKREVVMTTQQFTYTAYTQFSNTLGINSVIMREAFVDSGSQPGNLGLQQETVGLSNMVKLVNCVSTLQTAPAQTDKTSVGLGVYSIIKP